MCKDNGVNIYSFRTLTANPIYSTGKPSTRKKVMFAQSLKNVLQKLSEMPSSNTSEGEKPYECSQVSKSAAIF
ncbi:hypothetical protein E2320_014491 [Naja naja]|nr:hypothetical protein E2320_014491 [Naja naja]